MMVFVMVFVASIFFLLADQVNARSASAFCSVSSTPRRFTGHRPLRSG